MGEQQIGETEGQSQEYVPVLSSGFSILETPPSLLLSSECVVEGGEVSVITWARGKGGLE